MPASTGVDSAGDVFKYPLAAGRSILKRSAFLEHFGWTGETYRSNLAPYLGTAKGLGFTLEEIRNLLELRVEPGANCEAVEAEAAVVIARIDIQMHSWSGCDWPWRAFPKRAESAIRQPNVH